MLRSTLAIFLFCVFSCEKNTDPYADFREVVENLPAIESLSGWEIAKQNGIWVFSYTLCNQIQAAFTCNVTPDIKVGCSSLSDEQSINFDPVQKTTSLFQLVYPWEQSFDVKALNGGSNCSSGFKAFLGSGDILVYKQENQDNQIGFGYKRKPIGQNWQLYTPQP